MKSFYSLLTAVFFVSFSFGQSVTPDLPVNPLTKLISIEDSVRVGVGYSIDSVKELIEKWSNYMGDRVNAGRMLAVPIDKKITLVYASIDKYYQNGQRHGYYKKINMYCETLGSDGKVDTSDKTNGCLSVNINFLIRNDYIRLSFTDLSFTGSRNEMANLEDKKLLGPDGVHFLTEAQKPWTEIKKLYFRRLQILAANFKRFLSTHYQHPYKDILLKERW